jgi:hypothetical protein
MAKRTIRVYKSGDVWIAKKDGTSKAYSVKNTQKEAYLAAKNIALNQGLSITVYHPTGGIKAVINPKEKEDDSNCFITTACIKYFNLQDNCYELQTLRKFRDNYLLKSNEGQNLVKEYYFIAPALVKQLEVDKRKGFLFKEIFEEIRAACNAIELGEYENAKKIYIEAVGRLADYFKST